MKAISNNIQPERWLALFILLHLLAWTLAPILVRHNLPMDALEGATWGHQLQWGYDKNPFMNAWLTRLALFLGGSSGWMIYLFSQISVVTGFVAIWQLAKKMVSPLFAVLSVVLLEGIQYFNFHAIDFNDNTLELSFWALTVLFFYQAITNKKLIYWCLVGLFAGLSMMVKYYTAMLLAPLFLFLIVNNNARKEFFSPRIYIGLIIFLLVITPHIIWLFAHNFVTIHYAFNRVASPPNWQNHLFFPAQFIWQQFEVLLPVIILLAPFYFGKNYPVIEKLKPLTNFNKSFLLWISLGPLLLTVLISLIGGLKLRAGWGQPLLSYFALLLLVFLKPKITKNRLKLFFILFSIFFGLIISGYSLALISAKSPSSANFPGKIIATELTNNWHQNFQQKLNYVVGPRWLAGNIAFYSSDRPAVYMEADPIVTQWIDEKKLKQQGGLFVWDVMTDSSYTDLKRRFKNLQPAKHLQFNWLRNAKLDPIDIWVAYLPPKILKVNCEN